MSHHLPPYVHVIERGWLSANLIIFKGPAENTVVDSGYVSHAAQTVELVRGTLNGEVLHRLLNTHLHSDHCGGNAALQAAYPDLETLIPPGQAPQVKQWDPVALTYVPTGQNCPRFEFQGLLQPGSELVLSARRWEIHAAPGHDPHSVLLFEPLSRCLISADALWENGFGVVFPELEGEDAFSSLSKTLDLIDSLKPTLVIPGHGRVFSYSDVVMDRARNRLAAFIDDPVKHAKHATKVLLKFKLLEAQRTDLQCFLRWATATPHIKTIHQRFFKTEPFDPWLRAMTLDLVRSNVALIENGSLINL
jgi:glyoxylase-like metal-dependent hydrolase (beta-lactamase superfamily II)